MNIFVDTVNHEKYFLAKYFLESKTNLRDASWNLAIGQSVGNPNVRNKWETEELFANHSCLVIGDEEELRSKNTGEVLIAFPVANIDIKTDGVSQLMCHLMGGQMDIDSITQCHLLDVTFPTVMSKEFKGPKYGIKGIREYTQVFDKPLLGGIVKPKVGITPEVLLELVKEMVEGGVNFIKEDEIMSNPALCPLEVRIPLIMNYLKDKKVIYSVCINADSPYLLERVKRVHELGGNSVHINFWAGLGVYKSIRDLDLPLFIHFQKSGDKILTSTKNAYRVSWHFMCKLATMMGVDFIHAGMIGGYYNEEEDMKTIVRTLQNGGTIPALSCGMHPGLVDGITEQIGVDYMANCGGALHGHPGGTIAGTRAMRQAIDKNYGTEYNEAIQKWGKI